MLPLYENLIRGAASVRLPTGGLDYRSSMEEYRKSAIKRGMVYNEYSIRSIFRERLLGQLLFAIWCILFMLLTIVISDTTIMSVITSCVPFISYLVVYYLNKQQGNEL